MTDRTHDDPPAPDDRTRDITLPPMPDRPPPALPQEWAGLRPTPSAVDAPTTAVSRPVPPPTPAAPAAADVDPVEGDPEAEEGRRLAGRRTDEIAQPPRPVRERTLAFSSPEMQHRSLEPVRVGSKPRRWPWVVLTLLPILVIVGFGIAWLVLLNDM